MRKAAKQVALCGLLAALGAALMLLGTLVPIATYACPLLASLVLIAARAECGGVKALCVWAVTAVLSLLLAPDKEAAAFFLFLGYYPVLRPVLERVSRRLPKGLLKLAVFNLSVGTLYAVVLFVLPIRGLTEEFQTFSQWMLAAMLAVGNASFLLYDLLLSRLEILYRIRLQKTLRKLL